MNLVFYLIIFVFGVSVGSFLNCVIYRLKTGQSFLKGRSFCPHCKHKLGLFDLIPILSFIILKGKCRYCGKKISWQYPLVELITGVLFVSLFIVHCSLFVYIIFSFLIIIFVYDLKHYIIPDKVIYPAIATALIFNLHKGDFYSFLLSALGASGFFFLIWLVSRGKWMGFGDVKLAFLIGLFLGFPNITVALFSAFLIGAIIGLGLIALGKKTLKSQVPFGPFLVIGTFVALLWGEKIVSWYLSFI